MHCERKIPCLPGAGGYRDAVWLGADAGDAAVRPERTPQVSDQGVWWHRLCQIHVIRAPYPPASGQVIGGFWVCAIYTKTACKLRKYSWKKFYHKFQKSLAKSRFFLYTNSCCDIDSDEAWGCHAYAWVFRGANVKLANWRQVTVQVKNFLCKR